MAFFDPSYVTTVATVGSRILDEKNIPNSARNGAIEGIARNASIIEYAMEAMISSIAVRSQRMYRYAESKYTHGSPSGEIYSANQGEAEVLAVLRSALGAGVVIEYSRVGLLNPLHMAWQTVIATYGYDPKTNKLAKLEKLDKTAAYLKDLQVILPAEMVSKQLTATEQWGLAAKAGYCPSRKFLSDNTKLLVSPSPVISRAGLAYPKLLLKYEFDSFIPDPLNTDPSVNALIVEEKEVEIDIAGFSEAVANADYFQVKYINNGIVGYTQYQSGTGGYPTLDKVLDTPIKPLGSFFPFLHLRHNKTAQNRDKNSPAYKTSKKMADYIGIDFDQLVDDINGNPNIADVEQATVIMAVPIDTTNQMELRYLFDYFNKLHLAYPSQYATPEEAALSAVLNSGNFNDINNYGAKRTVKGATVIQDKLFAMSLHNLGVYKSTGAANGTIGQYSKVIEKVTEAQSNGVDEDGKPQTINVEYTYHSYRKQITENIYEEVKVQNLTMNFYLSNNYVTSTNGSTAKTAVIPIDNSISSTYSLPDREKLYSFGLHIIFNAKQVTKLEWYQKPEFGILLKIAAVVILVYTWDPQWLVMASAAMAGGAALISFVYAVAAALIEQMVYAYVFQLFVQAVGMDLAILTAIVLAVYTGYSVYENGGSLKGLPFAKEMMFASTGIAKGVSTVASMKLGELKDEYDRFNLYTSAQEKKLKEAEDLLNSSNGLTPFTVFGESCNDFLSRTLCSNPGVLGLDAIESYVSMALVLPKINQTIEGES